jgi:nitroreductase
MDRPMSIDEVLTTARAVRKRLDFTRAVERKVLEECLAIAQQAPNGGNLQNWGFVIVTDPVKRIALAI